MPLIGAFLQRSRHGTTFYFRRRVPDDLRLIFGRRQLYRSLGTAELRSALAQARRLAAETDDLFARLREMTKQQPPGTGEPMPYGDVWGSWGKPEEPVNGPRTLPKDAAAPIPLPAPLVALQRPSGVSVSHDARTRINYKIVVTEDIAAGTKTTEIDVDPEKPGDHEAALAMLDRIKGNAAPQPASEKNNTLAIRQGGLKLLDAVKRYLAKADLKPSSLKNYKSYLYNVAIAYFGEERELSSIGQREFAEFVEHAKKLGRSDNTVEGYVSAFTAMGKWHRARGENVPVWTSETLLNFDRTPANKQRPAHPFNDLGVLFKNAARYRESEPEKFWATVATAFMGCRIEELGQVNLNTDFLKDEAAGIYYLKLDEDKDADGRTLKTIKKKASFRVVPIHSALVAAGFIDFLQDRRAEGYSRPFERLYPLREMSLGIEGRDDDTFTKWTHEIDKWATSEWKFLKLHGYVKPQKGQTYFHSMRHTFSTYLATCQQLREEDRCILTGHEYGGEQAERYTKLRHDPVFMSRIVEEHLWPYCELLEEALRSPLQIVNRTGPGSRPKRPRKPSLK